MFPFSVMTQGISSNSPNRPPNLFEIMQAIISIIIMIGGGYLLVLPDFSEKAVVTATMGAVVGFYFSVAYIKNEKRNE